ncbi:hypothetical protein DNK55_17445 [Streptomyces sp. AC1-42T]|nr:hypothetical protein DNK55_17445 [Streptomyces sp. AC1-42T]
MFRSVRWAPTVRSRTPPPTTVGTRPSVVREGNDATTADVDSVLLALDTAAQAQTRRIEVSEHQRPRLAHGPGTRSRKGLMPAT